MEPIDVKRILSTIQATSFDQVQSPDLLMEYGFTLQAWIAYTAEQVATTKRLLHEARRKGMLRVMASMEANQKTAPVSLLKEYVNDQCAVEVEAFQLAERANSACIHCLDFIRTCLATLRGERQQMRNIPSHGPQDYFENTTAYETVIPPA